MHNLKELRNNAELYKKKFKERNFIFNIDEFIEIDKQNRELIKTKETLEQEKKSLSKSKTFLIYPPYFVFIFPVVLLEL